MNLDGPVVILTLLMAVLFSSKGVCQTKLDITAGPDVNFLDSRKFYSPVNVPRGLRGSYVGADLQHNLNDRVSLLTGITLITKNYSIHRKDSVNTQFDFRNTFIQLPLILRLKVLDVNKWNLSVSGGGFVSHWRSSHIKGILPNVFNYYVDNQSNVHVYWEQVSTSYQFTKVDVRYEYGVAGGLVLGYEIRPRLEITSSLLLCRSLTNLRSDDSPGRFNNTVSFGFGIEYTVRNK